MDDPKTLYQQDFVAWSRQQAEALRAAARTGTNQQLDWRNLAEEIEDLGKSERRELASRLSVVIEHLMKLAHSRSRNPRNGWRRTIRRERAEIDRMLEDSPSLRREVSSLIEKETKRTIDVVTAELRDRGELRDAPGGPTNPSNRRLGSYTEDQILGDWFPADPAREAE